VDEGDKAAREQQLHACHQRSADKLLKLCFDNGGIYIKLGQHIGQLVGHGWWCRKSVWRAAAAAAATYASPSQHHPRSSQQQPYLQHSQAELCQQLQQPCLLLLQDHLLPEEYVVTMREHMLDKCPVSSYAEVRQIIQEDLGSPPEQLFQQFSETPIASASLAQVRGPAVVACLVPLADEVLAPACCSAAARLITATRPCP
jgi:hypothetical protein